MPRPGGKAEFLDVEIYYVQVASLNHNNSVSAHTLAFLFPIFINSTAYRYRVICASVNDTVIHLSWTSLSFVIEPKLKEH